MRSRTEYIPKEAPEEGAHGAAVDHTNDRQEHDRQDSVEGNEHVEDEPGDVRDLEEGKTRGSGTGVLAVQPGPEAQK